MTSFFGHLFIKQQEANHRIYNSTHRIENTFDFHVVKLSLAGGLYQKTSLEWPNAFPLLMFLDYSISKILLIPRWNKFNETLMLYVFQGILMV